ncbi:MAG: SatD family protein [Candidatus Marinimicrobia bacterium]|nr:SatD family protein [Candidatus Neomarinimicrobiota bacterium]
MNKIQIGIIGDIISSRELSGYQRQDVQKNFKKVMRDLNNKYRNEILSKFVNTTDDEFQGLLNGGERIQEIIWDVEMSMYPNKVRFGVGFGELYTPIETRAIAMDDPVWHNGRSAIVSGKMDGISGGVYKGFGTEIDEMLNGFSYLLWSARESMTEKQRNIVSELRKGFSQVEVAKKFKISRQAVTKHASSAEWKAYSAGELAFGGLLKYATEMRRNY